MLNVERFLQFNIAMLVVLGAFLLGLGNGNMWLPAMALVASVVSLCLTDIYKVLRLNRFVANLASVLAAVYSLNDFFRSNSETQLLAIASFLIYLQILLQFQKKTSRIYWQLLVLSLLQVVVAAALYVRVESGVLFFVYMLLAISAMTLTYIYRENREIRERYEKSKAELKQGQREPVMSMARFNAKPILVFESQNTETNTTRVLLRRAIASGCAAACLAIVMFYCVPKPSKAWRGVNLEDSNRTGFATEIRFDQSGRIISSDRVAFRASFTDQRTGRQFELQDEPYFRGMALHLYSLNNNVLTWQEALPMATRYSVRGLQPHPRRGALDMLEIDLEPSDSEILFSMSPCHALPETPRDIRVEPFSFTLMRDGFGGQPTTQPYRYQLALGTVRDQTQPELSPYYDPQERSFEEPMHPGLRIALSQRKADKQRYLANLAKEITADIPRSDHRRMAQALNDHFLLSNRYRYTLDFGSVDFNRELDPVEDFVQNHRVGHCEYFASALCLMLRSLNIPSRIVVGYRGGDYNNVAQHYVVRDKHAHAWVECYLDPDELTAEELEQGLGSAGGAWLRLDPTPGTLAEPNQDLFTAANDAFDLAQVLWDDLVFGFNKQRQSSYYNKLLGESSYLDQVFQLSELDNKLGDITEDLGIERGYRRILAQFAVVVLLATFALIWWIWRRRRLSKFSGQQRPVPLRKILGSVATLLSPKLGSWISGTEPSPLRGEPVPFYEELTRILKQAGWQREESQTQSEFLREVKNKLDQVPEFGEAASHLEGMADAFYLVRFGGGNLSPPQHQTILEKLAKLETLLKNKTLNAVGSIAKLN